MAGKKTHQNEEAKHSETSIKDVPKPLDKDYAHYPPTPVAQVTAQLTKKLKATEVPNNCDNANVGPGNLTVLASDTKNGVESKAERVVNGSEKIVNSVDESYSDGSGGAFEATEQVTE